MVLDDEGRPISFLLASQDYFGFLSDSTYGSSDVLNFEKLRKCEKVEIKVKICLSIIKFRFVVFEKYLTEQAFFFI